MTPSTKEDAVVEAKPAAHPVATPGYRYTGGRLACRGVDLARLADTIGTPCYVYDAPGMRDRYCSLVGALAPLSPEVRYAVKANPNLAVVSLFRELGAGMDVVSMGEMERAWLGGTPMREICFAGVAKGDDELRAALHGAASPIAGTSLAAGRDITDRGPIGLINAESESELERLSAIASELSVEASCTLRINPGVTAGANDKVRVGATRTKFGLPPDDLVAIARRCARLPGLRFRGIHLHLGSQIDDLGRYGAALPVVTSTMDRLRAAGLDVDTLNVGAGVAVSYTGEPAPTDEAFAAVMRRHLEPRVALGERILIEPGRELVGQAGVLLTRVRHVKLAGGRTIVTTDAGLNALIRPAMYGAQHTVWPAVCPADQAPDPIAPLSGVGEPVDVVGPVCESSDIFARDWSMPRVQRGDVLVVFTAGAYGMSMAMTFNDFPLPAEVMIDDTGARVVRERQTHEALLAETAIGLDGGRPVPIA